MRVYWSWLIESVLKLLTKVVSWKQKQLCSPHGFTLLRRQESLQICSCQARDTREFKVQRWPISGLRTGSDDGVSPPKAGRQKTQEEMMFQARKNPQWPSPRPEESHSAYGPISLFTLCKPLTDWVRPSFWAREILCALTTDINSNLIQTLQTYPD